MEQGNPNKIDAIIEEIVKNNTIFKLKSPIEQDKEKDSIAKGINTALSALNEVGKELVIQELSIDPDEKFKGFIDSVGRVDIVGMTKYTTSIVNAKIEEAEREGINLRKDSTRTTNDKSTSSKDVILTIAALDSMVNNFNNLSKDERQEVINNWSRLTRAQQAEVMESYAARIQEGSKKLKDESDKKLAENFSKVLKKNSDELKSDEKEDLPEDMKRQRSQQYIEYIQNAYPLLYKEFLKYLKEKDESISGKDVLEIVDKFESFRKQKMAVFAKKMVEESERIESGEQTKFSEELKEKLEQVNEIDNLYTTIMDGKPLEAFRDDRQSNIDEENSKVEKNGININGETVDDLSNNVKITHQEKISQDIKNVYSLLEQDGISKQQVLEAMNKYKEFMTQIPMKYINNIEELKSPKREEYLSYLLNKNCKIDPQIAKQLSEMNFDGQLNEILKNEDRRAEFIEQLGQSIEQINGIEDVDKTPETVGSKPLPEEVSAELQVIPVALQRINCQPEDIAKGMEAYKQIIEGLSPEEIEGTPETISQTLKKAAEEVELDGVVGDILKMMSQITFNGQISEILKNCKVEFLNSLETLSMQGPLLDPRVYAVNPEQYSNNAVDERIDENDLKAGFSALAVDLQIADQTIIRSEELVTDDVEQRKEEQIEAGETAEHEEKKDNTENSVIKKLQNFFGVYQEAKTSDSDLEEEISDLELASQKMMEDMQIQASQNGQTLQPGNKTPIDFVKDEDEFEQQ